MKRLIAIVVLSFATFVAGCATADRLNALRIGMSEPEVASVMGQPDSKSAQGDVLYYTYYLANDGMNREQPYLVRFVGGKVESFGRFAQLYDLYNRPIGGQPIMTSTGRLPVSLASIRPLPAEGLADQLMKLKLLKDRGALTDEEYQKAKDLLLNAKN